MLVREHCFAEADTEHLVKLRFTTGQTLERNQRGWKVSIANHQIEIRKILQESPSLKRELTPELLAESYAHATRLFAIWEFPATLPLPQVCPFTWDDILGGQQ